ncbi:MAG: cobalamin-dependent protein [Thermoleophilia bacterium]
MFGRLSREMLEAALRFDEDGMRTAVWQAVGRDARLDEVYLDLMAPVLREVGERWLAGTASVAQEHFCTTAVLRFMGELRDLRPPAPVTGLRVVLAGVETSRHDVGLQMVGDLLDADGWRVFSLGTDLPATAIRGAVAQIRPDLLGLSASAPTGLRTVKEVVDAIRGTRVLDGLPVMVGGLAFTQPQRQVREAGADGWAADARDAVHTARRLLRLPHPAWATAPEA